MLFLHRKKAVPYYGCDFYRTSMLTCCNQCLTESVMCIVMTDAVQTHGGLEAERTGPSGTGSPATTGKAVDTRIVRVTTAGEIETN